MTDEAEKAKDGLDAGAALKAARLKKGLKQDDVAKALRIPVRQVSALEHNRKEEFPGSVYYRGSLQSYCEFLDLDFLSLWRQLSPPPPAPVAAKAAAPHPRKPVVPVPQVTAPLIVPGLFFGGLLLAAGVVWFVNRPPTAPPPAPAAPAPAPEPAPAAAPAAPAPRTGRHLLRIEPVNEAWVRLRVDRKLVFEGNLPAGRPNLWEAERSFGLRTPRETALRIWLDDQPVDLAPLPRDSFGNILIQPPLPAPSLGDAKPAAPPPVPAPESAPAP